MIDPSEAVLHSDGCNGCKEIFPSVASYLIRRAGEGIVGIAVYFLISVGDIEVSFNAYCDPRHHIHFCSHERGKQQRVFGVFGKDGRVAKTPRVELLKHETQVATEVRLNTGVVYAFFDTNFNRRITEFALYLRQAALALIIKRDISTKMSSLEPITDLIVVYFE